MRNNYKGFNKIIYQDEKIMKFLVDSRKYGKYEVIIDIDDYDKIKNYRWYINYKTATATEINHFYIITHFNHHGMKLHRVILNTDDPKILVDHINHNTLDNRKQNLRFCTTSQNAQNSIKHIDNTSGYKGVFWIKNEKKWRAQIVYNKKQICISLFDTKLEAAYAYNQAALKYHGEFAKLNEIGI